MAKVGRPIAMTPEKKCVICGFDRIVDRAHIIPKTIFKNLKGYTKYIDYDSEATIYLCRNHHALFDFGKLTEDEGKKLRESISHFQPVIENLLNSEIKPIPKKVGRFEIEKAIKRFNRWKEKFYWVLGYEYAGKTT